MTATTDARIDALLRAVLAAPRDDLPRLVYADAMEEAGQGERAEFIRLSIESGLDFYPESLSPTEPPPFDSWPSGMAWVGRRGFVAEVRTTLAAWLEHGPRIVREHPVERVVVTDVEPIEGSTWEEGVDPDEPGQAFWAFGPRVAVLRENFDLMSFATRDAALSALSAACLAWAGSAP